MTARSVRGSAGDRNAPDGIRSDHEGDFASGKARTPGILSASCTVASVEGKNGADAQITTRAPGLPRVAQVATQPPELLEVESRQRGEGAGAAPG